MEEIVPVEQWKTTRQQSSPYVESFIIGGGGGTAFNFQAADAMLEKIWVWVGASQIKAVKIWLTNGSVQQFGIPSGPYQGYSFQQGETITSMSLWGNGVGTRLGVIKFKTSRNKEFVAKMTKNKLKQEYPIDVGSGVCVGVVGRCGNDVDCMGFIFIKPIRQSALIDVVYPTIEFEQPNVQISSMDSTDYSNDRDEVGNYDFTTSTTITKKEFWSITAAVEFAYKASVTAGIPELAQVKTSWSLKVSVSGTYGMENTEETTKSWTFPVTVPPHSTAKASLSLGQADINLPYEATLQITTTDGSVLEFPLKGVYTGVAYTQAIFKNEIIPE